MVVVCFPSSNLDMPDRVRKMAWKFRLTYTILFSGLLYFVMHERKTDLWNRDGTARSEVMGPFLFFVIVGFVTFWIVQGTDPGYLGADDELDFGDDLAVDEDEEAGGSGGDDSRDFGGAEHGADAGGGGREGAGAAPEPAAAAPADEDDQERIPLRAKYCRISERYVATYDHFCGVLGTCIGERNRFRFWLFLFAHSMLIWWSIGLAFSGIRYRRTWGEWWSENGYAVALLFVFWSLFAFVCGLFVWHSWLLATNSTQYEFMRQRRISYLRKFRICDLPFSEGLLGNLRFCCGADAIWELCTRRKWSPRRWEEPKEFDRESKDWWRNPWENAYWSCC